MRQLTSLDAQFLAMESPSQYGHVGGLAILDPSTTPDGELTAAHLCRLVSERLHLLRPFRWRLVDVPFGLDHPYWIEDPDFDLDFHIRDTGAPPPGDDRALAEQVARIFARPLDRTRPLWELYLIHGLAGGHVAALTKIHHAVVDGVSGAEILGLLLDPSPEGREIPPLPDRGVGERVPGQIEMLARGLLGMPRQPLRALRGLPSMVSNATSIPGASVMPGVPTLMRASARLGGMFGPGPDNGLLEVSTARAPRTRFNARVSPHRRFAFGSLPLDSIKALKNELGITVNDVVVALCASGVRDWLLARDELPEEPLVAMVPVSVRAPDEAGTFGNRVSFMVVPIPTHVEDPRERLMAAHSYLASAKERHQALPADILTEASNFIPPALFTRASRGMSELFGRLRPPLNLVISNVPGPRIPLYMAGARLEGNYPVSVVTDGVGLNLTVMSYRDDVDFGIICDRELVDDAWSLMHSIAGALEELCEVICGSRQPVVTGRGRRFARDEGAAPRQDSPTGTPG
jgi:WS/DGAT/MGAT family acyltransferase